MTHHTSTPATPEIPVGTSVLAWPGWTGDAPIVTRTRGAAWQLAGGTWIVPVEGHTGGLWLDHVRTIPAHLVDEARVTALLERRDRLHAVADRWAWSPTPAGRFVGQRALDKAAGIELALRLLGLDQ